VEVPNCKCFFSAAEIDTGSLVTVIYQLLLFSSAYLSKTVLILERAMHVFAYFCGHGTPCLPRGITVLIVVIYY
jgi:hypothetical protein